ncbi:12396_t:CDS:2 [Rhizophagus irregularis]|nr:12396_t:CDS:2 [Rhizophagus irregularis]
MKVDEFIDADEFIGVDKFIDVDEFMDKIKNIDKYYFPLEIDSTIRSMFQNYEDFRSKKLKDQNKHNDIFNKAELKRRELTESQKLGPKFAKKPHPRAIYTSKPLSFFISKCSSNNSSSSISSYNKQGYSSYISEEQEFDIDVESSSLAATSRKRNIEESNIEIHDDLGKYLSD